MVEFFPTIKEIEQEILKSNSKSGKSAELEFLKLLQKHLSQIQHESFEVYYQPPWDGSLPDVVILRKNHGVLIVEVKDWNLDLYKIENSEHWTCNDGRNNPVIKSPVAQAEHYKSLFYTTYNRALAQKRFDDNRMYSLVESAVFFYGSSDAEIKNFFGDYLNTGYNNSLTSDWITLLTLERLQKNGLDNTQSANFLLRNPSKNFTDDVYNELRRVLKPSEQSKIKSLPKNLTPQQRRLATARTGNKIKLADGKTVLGSKIKGPAGCGKTTVLAYRAVDAYRKTGKPVAILTFNITLCNYIRDCISAALNDLPDIADRKKMILKNFFIIKHYHKFIHDYCNATNQELPTLDDYTIKYASIKYSTILVDETQDYQLDWRKTVFRLLEDDGEIVFFGDEDQNIYEREKLTTAKAIPNIAGRWNILKGSYRLNGKIVKLARAFQIKFFNGSVGNELEPIQQEFDFGPQKVEYHFLRQFDIAAVMKIFKENPTSNDDICILSQVIRNLRIIDKKLRDSDYPTITTFETEEEYQTNPKSECEKIRRNKKLFFNMESGKIKLSTIHSYKGWGIDTEILIIGDEDSASDAEEFLNDEMVYVGITRAVTNLIVINIGDKKYDEFFSAWIRDNK